MHQCARLWRVPVHICVHTRAWGVIKGGSEDVHLRVYTHTYVCEPYMNANTGVHAHARVCARVCVRGCGLGA